MTTTLMIVYPADGTARFDDDYYIQSHLPLVRKVWSETLDRAEAHLGVAGLDKKLPAYAAVTLLHFRSADAMQAALGGASAAQVLGDVVNFTTIAPVVQITSAA